MAAGTFMPGGFRTHVQKLSKGYWPWTEGIRSRLPMHYKKRFALKYMIEPAPVHYRPDPRKYTVDEFGTKHPVQNVPIPIYYPPEADEGLWGGVGIIKGFTKKKNWYIKPRAPKIWMPRIIKRVFYSEILDRWMAINCTQTTLDLIDDAFGFDNYILKTSEADLQSRLGMRLKREMLLTLVQRSMYPDDPQRAAEIAEKYQQFAIPEGEAEWVGLSLAEAEEKQQALEEGEMATTIHPLKHDYLEELIVKIKANDLEDMEETQKSWVSKLNPFKDGKSE